MVDLRPDQLATVRTILQAEVPAAEVWVFGSRAKWTARDTSDLDLAIIADKPIPLVTMNRLRRAFEETHLPFQVDVVDWRRTEERFRSIIEQDHVVLQRPFKHSDGLARVRRVVSLADCVDFVSGGTPSKSNPEYWNGRIPWVSAKDMKQFRITDSEDHVTEAALGNGARQVPPKTVLILVRGMTLHHDVPICLTETEVTFNQDVRGLRAKSHIDSDFLAYALLAKKPMLMTFVDSASHGTGRIHSGILSSLPIELPDLAEQRLISNFLRMLDDKIELNRWMNETLEAIARALFKSWFVDFDPVRAKAEGRDPGLPAPIADLFPDSFDDSELGEIPKEWTRAGISEWATALSGGTPSKSDPKLWDGDIPWISPKVMTDIHADETDQHVSQRAIGNGTRLAPSGSTLVMVRGMGLYQQVRVSQARREVSFNQDVKALVPTRIEASLLLFALLDAQQELLGRVESSGHGTGKLPSDVLLGHPITLPNASVQEELVSVFDSLNSRIASARDQSRTLTILRDALLPKLISGELRVKDAERLAAHAPV